MDLYPLYQFCINFQVFWIVVLLVCVAALQYEMETTPTLHHHVQGVYHSQTSGDPLMFKGCNVYGSDNRNKEFHVNSENVQPQLNTCH